MPLLLDGMATPKESWIVFTLTMTTMIDEREVERIIWMDYMDGWMSTRSSSHKAGS
jgi:hypothetical protein